MQVVVLPPVRQMAAQVLLSRCWRRSSMATMHGSIKGICQPPAQCVVLLAAASLCPRLCLASAALQSPLTRLLTLSSSSKLLAFPLASRRAQPPQGTFCTTFSVFIRRPPPKALLLFLLFQLGPSNSNRMSTNIQNLKTIGMLYTFIQY